MSEQDTAERRRVITNNREFESASTVRRDWLRGLLARKTAPRDAAAYAVTTLARGSADLRRALERPHTTACALAGVPAPAPGGSGYRADPTPHPLAEAAAVATPARGMLLILAVLCGAAEDALQRDSWRHPDRDTRAYFTQLAAWGYPLAPVERLITGDAERGEQGETDRADTGPADGEPADGKQPEQDRAGIEPGPAPAR